MKLCTKCKEFKPIESYFSDKSKNDGLYPSCKDCKKVHQKEMWAGLPPIERLRRNLKRYNLTVEEYYEMVLLQDGKCAICKEEPVGERPYVDHCHKLGNIRGLLCSSCNFGLGHFKNDPNLLQNAINYLLAHMKVT
jgi:hypothetical protein